MERKLYEFPVGNETRLVFSNGKYLSVKRNVLCFNTNAEELTWKWETKDNVFMKYIIENAGDDVNN